LLIVRCV